MWNESELINWVICDDATIDAPCFITTPSSGWQKASSQNACFFFSTPVRDIVCSAVVAMPADWPRTQYCRRVANNNPYAQMLRQNLFCPSIALRPLRPDDWPAWINQLSGRRKRSDMVINKCVIWQLVPNTPKMNWPNNRCNWRRRIRRTRPKGSVKSTFLFFAISQSKWNIEFFDG